MKLTKSKTPMYIVIDNSMFIYQIEKYSEKKNTAGLILFKNLTDFKENRPLKKIDVAD